MTENQEIFQTEEYILKHAAAVHNYESLGRSLVHNSLLNAAKQVRENGESDEIAFDLQVKITPLKESTCELICFYDSVLNIQVCVHADIPIISK